ncbi:MAG: hypothetical protein EXS55_01150 [Candidatus Magasanikbacteria bacterium]|nr:hypothetical protein [Candidatus Magasanikbacteria bacterium]
MSTINFPHPCDWNRLVAAARAAEVANNGRKEAYDALRAAFESAPWGRNGSVFITNRADSIGGSTSTRTLHMQGRRVATCDDDGWVKLVDPAQAEAQYAEVRKRNREYDLAYKAERDMLVDRLVETSHSEASSFAEWTFSDGQMGGFFNRQGSAICVAAQSALAAAAKLRPIVPAITAEDIEDDELDGRRPVRSRHF